MMSMIDEIDVDTDSEFMAAYDTKLGEKTEMNGVEKSNFKAKEERKYPMKEKHMHSLNIINQPVERVKSKKLISRRS